MQELNTGRGKEDLLDVEACGAVDCACAKENIEINIRREGKDERRTRS